MKKTCCLLFFILVMVFSHLAYAAPPTELPNLIGTWRGTTTPLGDTTAVAVKLVVTKEGADALVPNGFFEGTLTIGTDVVTVNVGNNRDFPYRVMINSPNNSSLSTITSTLDWLPGPMLLVRGFGWNSTLHRPFILKKTTP